MYLFVDNGTESMASMWLDSTKRSAPTLPRFDGSGEEGVKEENGRFPHLRGTETQGFRSFFDQSLGTATPTRFLRRISNVTRTVAVVYWYTPKTSTACRPSGCHGIAIRSLESSNNFSPVVRWSRVR